jgi:glycosyltransferase involved in cell wall biosynthesis
MKIMQLLPELNSGGVERGTLEIARALIAAGHESIVVSNGGRLVAQLEAEGSQHLSLAIHKKSLSSLWQIRPLRKLIQQHQPDIVHVRSRVPAWLTHFALKGIPLQQRPHLISTVHGFYSTNRYSAIMTQAEKVIAVSDSVVKYITEHYQNCPPEHIVRIYRGISPQEFPHGYQPSALWINQTFKDFPQLENKFLVCLPGRITRLKGHETLIELMQQLQNQYPNLHAVVVGGADAKKQAYLEELESNIQSKGLREKITFVGHRSDIREWLAFSDVVLSLSNQGSPSERSEQHAGRPVRASRRTAQKRPFVAAAGALPRHPARPRAPAHRCVRRQHRTPGIPEQVHRALPDQGEPAGGGDREHHRHPGRVHRPGSRLQA